MTQPAGTAAGPALAVTVDALAAELIALYATAEQQLMDSLARIARHGLQDRAGVAQLLMLGQMRRAAERVAVALQLQALPLSQRIAAEAAQRGDAAALAMLRAAVAGHPALARLYLPRIAGASGHAVAAANAIALDLADRLSAANTRILRFADDAYRAAVAEAATRLVLGREGLTPTTAQGLAWDELSRKGITGYTDTAGRQWTLSTYVEMATRTAVQRAYNASHEARLTAIGVEFLTVTSDGHPCPICQPWEGAVLSVVHTAGPVDTLHATTGRPLRLTVAATVDEARAAGLFHVNCKHTLVAYFPGVTRTRRREWTDADEARYKATQRLRALERAVRAAKREQAAALDDLARQRAARKVRAAQARIRIHVEQHRLVRRRQREQLDLGNR